MSAFVELSCAGAGSSQPDSSGTIRFANTVPSLDAQSPSQFHAHVLHEGKDRTHCASASVAAISNGCGV
jgi:hypothetical protein